MAKLFSLFLNSHFFTAKTNVSAYFFSLLQDTLDFVAYVAKDEKFFRACFVLECGGGSAQDVISTIGQAFELRFKEFLKKQPHKTAPER